MVARETTHNLQLMMGQPTTQMTYRNRILPPSGLLEVAALALASDGWPGPVLLIVGEVRFASNDCVYNHAAMHH